MQMIIELRYWISKKKRQDKKVRESLKIYKNKNKSAPSLNKKSKMVFDTLDLFY